jgi:hypothetical protein
MSACRKNDRKRKEEGRCADCGKKKDIAGVRCSHCRDVARKRNSTWERTDAGRAARQAKIKRYMQNPGRKICHNLRARQAQALKKNFKTGSSIRDLGCSIESLRLHLEAQFQPGMTWENYGRGKDKWNVDHIEPLVMFNLKDPEQIKIAFHYSNLQPLWQTENCSWGGRKKT